MKLVKTVRATNRRSNSFLNWVTVITAASFLLVVLLTVASRYLLKTPVLSSIELSRLFFVWSCFTAAALGYYRKSHIAISLITNRLPPNLSTAITFVVHLLSLVFFIVIIYYSLIVVNTLWETRLPILGISQSWFYLPVPFSFLFMSFFNIEFIQETYLRLTKNQD